MSGSSSSLRPAGSVEPEVVVDHAALGRELFVDRFVRLLKGRVRHRTILASPQLTDASAVPIGVFTDCHGA